MASIGGSEFDCIVVCDTETERQELVKELRRFEGYRIREERRDWVNMAYTGPTLDGDVLPQEYMNLHDCLVERGFVQKYSYWGSRRFEKSRDGNA
ncbi:hypothetical protein TARUN_716 [Trichoderma arundinaceum]|uniref:Uncharacterized protein n=1 Tax=Trichoderma arundinaceum TaxID=490622 RepID=A0A395NZL1_TRIAR|nr:hypothetical protein TARUN_716 [Trichoderma arundinaceum]